MRIRRPTIYITAALLAATTLAPPVQADSLLFGQTQSYTATMRADRRVVTHAKIVFTNSGSTDQTAAAFTMPDGIKASDVSVYQIIPPLKDCQSYETLQQWKQRAVNDATDNAKPQQDYYTTRKCLDQPLKTYDLDYNFKDYVSTYSYNIPEGGANKISFEKLAPKQNGNTYTLPLSLPVQPKKAGALLVAYIADGFVSEFAGSYSYTYKTLKVDSAVDNVTVAVVLDEDLYSKGIKARTGGAETATSGTAANKGMAAMDSAALIDLQNSVGRSGTITRSGSHLLPGDSFTVSGSFADSPWKLYYNELALAVAILIGGAVIGWLIWKRRQGTPAAPSAVSSSLPAHATHDAAGKPTKTPTPAEPPYNPVRALLAALLGIMGVVVSTIIYGAVTSTTRDSAPGYYSNLLPYGSLALMLIYLYFLVVLPLFLTVRHGYKTIFTWATLQVVLLIITIIVMGAVSSTTATSTPLLY